MKLKIKGVNVSNTLTFCVSMCALLAVGFLFIRALPLISPLVAAFLISLALEPLIKQLMKHIKLKRAFAAPAVIILLLALVFALLWAVTLKLMKEYNALLDNFPSILQGVYANILALLDRARVVSESLPFDISVPADLDALSDALTRWTAGESQNLTEGIAKTALSTVSRVPNGIIFAITLLLSTFFLLMGRERHIDFFKRNLPQKWLDNLASFRETAFSALFGYLRAQLIIMCILFVLLSVGFLVLGVRYSFVVAFVTALMDALPVFGSSMILLPWALWSVLIGEYFTGIGLVVLFLVCSGLRRLIEPKILSSSIGVDALMVVTTMYAGLRLFGIFGLIAGPLIYILLRTFIGGMMKGRTFKEYFLIEDEI